jgi:hypothetical protein
VDKAIYQRGRPGERRDPYSVPFRLTTLLNKSS